MTRYDARWWKFALLVVFACEIRGERIGSAATARNSAVPADGDWKSSAELADDGACRLSWKPTERKIVLMVEARALGYVGVGLSLDGRMAKADIAVGWVNDKTKKAHLLVSPRWFLAAGSEK